MNCEEKNGSKLETTMEETWLTDLMEKAENMLRIEMHEERDAAIFRVPKNIRDGNREAYTPKIVSLGPFHCKSLNEWNEKLKWSYLNRFLARNNRVQMKDYLKLIEESEHRARSAYSENVGMDSNAFSEMMLLDCCFVLEFLLLQNEEQSKHDRAQAANAQQQGRPDPAVHPTLPRTTTTTLTTRKKDFDDGGDNKDNRLPGLHPRSRIGRPPAPEAAAQHSTHGPRAAESAAVAEGRGSNEVDPVKRTRKWALPLIQHDLLMLENQLPLFLLQSLFQKAAENAIASVPPLRELIVNFFVHFSLFRGRENPVVKNLPIEITEYHHLLHLFHKCIAPQQHGGVGGGGSQQLSVPCAREPVVTFLAHFGHSYSAPPQHGDGGSQQLWVPCARELREARVKFVKKEGTGSFMDIEFQRPGPFDVDSFWASKLKIPEIRIDDDTNTLFRNLIAFEQCCPWTDDFVSAYALFMDEVIDTEQDVALLRPRGIVVSGLGSDNDVAQLFNQLCKEVTVDLESCYIRSVMAEVNQHCNAGWNMCCASLKHTYFSKPWSILSVIAAIILFVLTLLQTLYSILSYKKQ